MMTVSYDQRSYLRLQDKLQVLMLPKEGRKKILTEIGKYEKKKTKKDIRSQQSPSGTKWKKRERGNKKMFKKLPKHLKYAQSRNNWEMDFGWLNSIGYVANYHQEGLPQKFRAKEMWKENKKNNRPDPRKTPATRQQAKDLKKLGYKISKYKMTEQDEKDHSREIDKKRREILKKNGGFHNPDKFKYKKVSPTIKWIVANMNMAAANKAIADLEGRKIRNAWQIERPKRELLGVSPRRVAMIIKKELKRQSAS
ncbi:phage virion morphogenesis protein [Vibrio algicola]|uniref:Phage virion morphogenesis protein n=1 Tax=Vibrio algicola TaxID=2662262 RepID=A0A5Q0TC95_9VIBR|nr:phage virion morphogenesis protein [Vibrio algicola]